MVVVVVMVVMVMVVMMIVMPKASHYVILSPTYTALLFVFDETPRGTLSHSHHNSRRLGYYLFCRAVWCRFAVRVNVASRFAKATNTCGRA